MAPSTHPPRSANTAMTRASRAFALMLLAAGCGSTTTARPVDASAPLTDAVAVAADTATSDVSVIPGVIGANGGTVTTLHFAAFGDTRPPNQDEIADYPTAIITSVFQGIQGLSIPFAVATGDYMFATNSISVDTQLTLFLSAEAMYAGYVFHGMGNHECNGTTAGNCPNLNEYANVVGFRTMLQADLPTAWHDWVVHTFMGDAHFIMVAPNAWSSTQATWLTGALAATGMRYTFTFMHEPPSSSGPPMGATAAEALIDATPSITLKVYGHTHEYRHETTNSVITGNAGAPLESRSGAYGFIEVLQRADGNIVVNEYHIGTPATLSSSFVVTPTGEATQ